jgi:uncharacterized membrane protein YedE/YeeE
MKQKPLFLIIAGAIGGALLGFAWWYFVGCDSGKCLITSNPLHSTLYGGTMGALALMTFRKDELNKPQN